MAKLWDKGFEINAEIEKYTVGRDRELDLYLAQDDVLGSMAHITMLESIGLLEKDELAALLAKLKEIYGQALQGDFEIEDGKSNPRHVAADLLSQAEHDRLASAVLVTDSYEFACAVSSELEEQIPMLSRADIARESIDKNGKIIVADTLYAAIEIANEIAPEHLELCVDNPFDYLDKIRHAGSIFMGRNCPEALGDYFAGPNHTLPTSGTAKFSSPLSVDDFVKKTQYTYYTKDALSKVARDVEYFAKKEGLTAHAKSAVIRIEE